MFLLCQTLGLDLLLFCGSFFQRLPKKESIFQWGQISYSFNLFSSAACSALSFSMNYSFARSCAISLMNTAIGLVSCRGIPRLTWIRSMFFLTRDFFFSIFSIMLRKPTRSGRPSGARTAIDRASSAFAVPTPNYIFVDKGKTKEFVGN